MKLRLKATLALSVFIGIVFVALIYGINAILSNALYELQRTDMVHDGIILHNALDERLETLDSSTMDWSSWDDTYYFAHDNNSDYVSSNLGDQSMANLHLSHLFIFDEHGTPVIMRSVDPIAVRSVPLDPALAEYFTPGSDLLAANETDTANGYIVVGERVYLFSSRPLLSSFAQGPYHGTLVFITPLDEVVQYHVSSLTNTSFTVTVKAPSDDPLIASEFITPRRNVALRQGTDEEGNSRIIGRSTFLDAHGSPFFLEYTSQQSPEQFAKTAGDLTRLIILLALAANILWAGIIIGQEFIIIRRLQTIETFVTEAKALGTLPMLKVKGDDEISMLANDVNDLFLTVYNANKELMAKTEKQPLTILPVPFERLRERLQAEFEPKLLGIGAMRIFASPITLLCDEERMMEVFRNLLDNAIKYRDKDPRIVIGCGSEGKNAVITVQDNGRGIPSERIPTIFSNLYRVDFRNHQKGDDSGLPFVKQIIDQHKGRITVDSEVGKGTIFTITIPME
jgi:sensor domain CHASE-containing protein